MLCTATGRDHSAWRSWGTELYQLLLTRRFLPVLDPAPPRSRVSSGNDDISTKMNSWSHQGTKNYSAPQSVPTQCRAMCHYKNNSQNTSEIAAYYNPLLQMTF